MSALHTVAQSSIDIQSSGIVYVLISSTDRSGAVDKTGWLDTLTRTL